MYRFIFLFFIFLIPLIFNMSIKETYTNYLNSENSINTISLKENEFKAENCGNVISISGSSGCPKITPYIVNELIYRGGNNNINII